MSTAQSHASKSGRRTLIVLGIVLVAAIVLVLTTVRRERASVATTEEHAATETPAPLLRSPAMDAVEPAESARTSAARDSVAAQVEPTPKKRARVEGRVTIAHRPLARGTPIKLTLQCTVPGLASSQEDKLSWGRNPSRQSDVVSETGEFAEDLYLGKWTVRCEVAGAKAHEKLVELDTDGTTVRCDFDLDALRIFRLYLVDAGGRALDESSDPAIANQVAALRVVLSDAPFPPDGGLFENRSIVTARTRSITNQTAGGSCTEVETSAGGRLWCGVLLERTVLASVEVPLAADSITLSIARDRLQAQVCSLVVFVRNESTTAPVENAEIRLTAPVGLARDGKSDHHGMWRVPEIVPADIEVRARAPGFVTRTRRITLDAARENQLTIDLPPEAIVSGFYRYPSGEPAMGSIILAPLARDRRPAFDDGVHSSATDPHGLFRIGDLEPKQYVVMDAARYQLQNGVFVYDPARLPEGVQLVDCSRGSVAGVVVTKTVPATR